MHASDSTIEMFWGVLMGGRVFVEEGRCDRACIGDVECGKCVECAVRASKSLQMC